jgi:hypothetical protein
LIGLRVAAGELVGATVESGGLVAIGLERGNAKVRDGEAVDDTLDEGDAVTLGDARGLGLGVGEGGMILSQRCNGTLAPPISLTSVSQRA